MAAYRLELLGSPVLRIDSQEVTFVRKKAMALIIYLAATRNRVSRDQLAELLWPSRPAGKALGALRTVLSEIRASIAGELLHAEGSILYLDESALECDLHRFRALLDPKTPPPSSWGGCLSVEGRVPQGVLDQLLARLL